MAISTDTTPTPYSGSQYFSSPPRGGKRFGALLIGIATVLAACSGTSGVDAAGGDDVESSTTAAPEVDESGDSATEPNTPAELITIEQVPGAPSQDVVSALDEIDYEGFPTPLVDTSQIISGGPPPDGIPPLDSPNFEVARAISWLEDTEPVVVLTIGEETRAYPIRVMTWHELVNDSFDDTPVTVSYCPLCNSAVAYVREVDGTVLDFGTSGRLFNSSLVMYDRQTESLWTHFDGRAVVGTLTGSELELVPMSMISWADFKESHPDALVLSQETGFNRSYGTNPYIGYDDPETTPFLFLGDPDDRLPAKERVVAIRSEEASLVLPLSYLAAEGVVELDLGDQKITAWHRPGTSTALDTASVAEGRDVGATGVFVADLDGQSLTFAADGDGFVDAETGSTWNILGEATAGTLEGSRLTKVEHLDTFWFAIAAFDPETSIVQDGS